MISVLKPKIFVELGVHTGNSFNAFCQAVRTLGLNTTCYGIDTWEGDPQSGFYDRSIYNDLLEYRNDHYIGFAYLYKMTFDEALSHFTNGAIDLLHIDGFHTYEAVKHDFIN